MEIQDHDCGCTASYISYYREYNALLGRWASIDPMQSDQVFISGYSFVFNKPTTLADPNGNCPFCPFIVPILEDMVYAALVSGATDYGTQVATNYVLNKDDPWTNVDLNEIAISSGSGALTFGATKVINSRTTRVLITSLAIPTTESVLNQAASHDWEFDEVSISKVGVDVLTDHAAERALKVIDVSEELEKIKISQNELDRNQRIYNSNPSNGNKRTLDETKSDLIIKERLYNSKISSKEVSLSTAAQKTIDNLQIDTERINNFNDDYFNNFSSKDNMVAPIVDVTKVWQPK